MRCTINSNADADSSNTKDYHQREIFKDKSGRCSWSMKNSEVTVKFHAFLKLGDRTQPKQREPLQISPLVLTSMAKDYSSGHQFHLLPTIGTQAELRLPTTGKTSRRLLLEFLVFSPSKKGSCCTPWRPPELFCFLHRTMHCLCNCIQLFKKQEFFHPY